MKTWKLILLYCIMGGTPIVAGLAGGVCGSIGIGILAACGVGLISGIAGALLEHRWTRSP